MLEYRPKPCHLLYFFNDLAALSESNLCLFLPFPLTYMLSPTKPVLNLKSIVTGGEHFTLWGWVWHRARPWHTAPAL